MKFLSVIKVYACPRATTYKSLLICSLIFFCAFAKAQSYQYQYVETLSENQSEITFTMNVFCDSKKTFEQSAYLSGLRCVLFDGIPGSKFSKPLLSEGERTLMDKHPDYFQELYGWRYADFLPECRQLTKLKKSGAYKTALMQMTVKVMNLRKDLEKNNIKTKLGI